MSAVTRPAFYERNGLTIYQGDCRQVLSELPADSVHCVISSPPYWGLRDYGLEPTAWGGEPECEHEWGEVGPCHHPGQAAQTNTGGKHSGAAALGQTAGSGQFCAHCGAWRGCLGLEPTPDLYVAHLVDVFREVRRVLRPDGCVWLNLGDSYAGSWGNYGARNGNQRSRIAERWHRPAYEDPRDGWDGLPPTANVPGLKPKDLCMIPARVALALQADGWWLRSDIIWSKPNPMPESVTDRPTTSHEHVFLLAKSATYFYDALAIQEPCESGPSDIRKMEEQLDRIGGKHKMLNDPMSKANEASHIGQKRAVGNPAGRNARTVWTIATAPYSGAHFATFPPALVEPCVKAGTSERGCCPACGASWVRVVELGKVVCTGGSKTGARASNMETVSILGQDPLKSAYNTGTFEQHEHHTTGWQPSCACYGTEPLPEYPEQEEDEPTAHYAERCMPIRAERLRLLAEWVHLPTTPATILDPFGGSGTVALVAQHLGRRAILIDLSADYCEMALERNAQAALLPAVEGD